MCPKGVQVQVLFPAPALSIFASLIAVRYLPLRKSTLTSACNRIPPRIKETLAVENCKKLLDDGNQALDLLPVKALYCGKSVHF
jgi:hypothetical protein